MIPTTVAGLLSILIDFPTTLRSPPNRRATRVTESRYVVVARRVFVCRECTAMEWLRVEDVEIVERDYRSRYHFRLTAAR